MKTKDPCPRTKNYGKSYCPGPVDDTPKQIRDGICKSCKGSGKVLHPGVIYGKKVKLEKKCKDCNGTGILMDKIY